MLKDTEVKIIKCSNIEETDQKENKSKIEAQDICLSYFSIVTKHQDEEGNLWKKAFNLGAHSPRGLELLTSMEGSTAAGMHAAEAVTESLQESQATSRRQRYSTNWEWGEVLKPQSRPLVIQLTLSKQFHSWRPRIQVYKPIGAIPIQITITVNRKVTDMVNFNNKIISKDGQRGFNKHHDPTLL